MKMYNIKILYYYEVPTLFSCLDEKQNNYIFALLDNETYEYIGKKVSAEDITLFLEGKTELKPIYEDQKTNFYLGKYRQNEFYADLYEGDYSDDLLPDDGLILIIPKN